MPKVKSTQVACGKERKFYNFSAQRCACSRLKRLWDQMEVVDTLANKCTEYAESYISDEAKKDDRIFVFAQSSLVTNWIEQLNTYSELFARTSLKGDIIIRWHWGSKRHTRIFELSPTRAYFIIRLFQIFRRRPIYSFHCAECSKEVPILNYDPWEFRTKSWQSAFISWVKSLFKRPGVGEYLI